VSSLAEVQTCNRGLVPCHPPAVPFTEQDPSPMKPTVIALTAALCLTGCNSFNGTVNGVGLTVATPSSVC